VTFSEFYFDLTHPNALFMQHRAPLLESNPVLAWQMIAAVLLAANMSWLFYFFS
jgi:hypothetical protein